MKELYELRYKKSERRIMIGTMAEIDRWLELFSEQDVVYEIWKLCPRMSVNVRKCHQMSEDVTKCH